MQAQNVQHHALPRWFVAFQDTAGLSLLIIALMGINGIVYASGVVPDVEDPRSWGLFGTLLFVLFFLAGAAMPGVALRAGAGVFLGEWYRRLACLLVSLLFFGLEVWCSITERSLTTITTPADRWLLSAIGQPNLPFSPTVLAISFAISLIVVVWGLVTGITAQESAEDVAHREELKTVKARAKAERRVLLMQSLGGAARATIDAAKAGASAADSGGDLGGDLGGEGADNSTANTPDNGGANTAQSTDDPGADSGGKSGPLSGGKHLAPIRMPRARAPLQGRITADELVTWTRDALGVEIRRDDALHFVKSMPGSGPTKGVPGAPVSAPKPITLQRARAKWGTLPDTQVIGA